MAKVATLQIGDTSISVPLKKILKAILEDAAQELAPSNAPQVGESWPGQGGKVAGLIKPDDGTEPYFLIVSTSKAGRNKGIAYGGYGTDEPGAASKWDGKANTLSLVNSETEHPAAEWAAGLTIEGHSDWYLPARRELALAEINVSELFDKEWHLSSTQCSSYDAWAQGFYGGSQGSIGKGGGYCAVAVRRVVYSAL